MNKQSVPTGLSLKKCALGYGIFATRHFRNLQTIALITGGRIVGDPRFASFYALKVGRNMWWDEDDKNLPQWDSYINHSEEPNAKIVLSHFNPLKPTAPLIAIRGIDPGEEITINYHEYGDRLYKSRRFHIPKKRTISQKIGTGS